MLSVIAVQEQLMVNVVLIMMMKQNANLLLDHLLNKVPQITTLLFTINPKWKRQHL